MATATAATREAPSLMAPSLVHLAGSPTMWLPATAGSQSFMQVPPSRTFLEEPAVAVSHAGLASAVHLAPSPSGKWEPLTGGSHSFMQVLVPMFKVNGAVQVLTVCLSAPRVWAARPESS